MTAKELFREIGGIRDEYVEEAGKAKRSLAASPYVRRTLAAAACLCLCLGSLYAVRLAAIKSAESDKAPEAAFQGGEGADTAAVQEAALPAEMPDEAAAEDAVSGGLQENALAQGGRRDDLKDLGGDISPEGGSFGGEGQAPGAAVEEGAGEKEQGSEEPGVSPAPADLPVTTAQQYAQTQDGQSQGSAGGDPDGEEISEAKLEIDKCELPLAPGEEITLEQARQSEVFGIYVPERGPEGFGFSGGSLSEEESRMSLSWTEGLKYLECRFSLYDAGQENRLADPEKPEDYDMSYYSIPLAESVPAEKISIVDCPIFRVQDLTEAILQSRAYQVPDAGDVSGPRMRFGILYEDGVLLEITAKGVTPRELGELLGLE